VPLLINSDAHAPQEVGADFEKAVAAAREAGYTQNVRLNKRDRSFAAL
jgi:histidinol-phosphatase (PHP family)